MNEESSQMQIRQKFDSYCKKVINNAAMDGHRTFGRIQKNECSLHEISLEDIESLHYFDTYPSDLNVFMLDNYRVVNHNDRLADAFRVLQEELRDILLMYRFLGMVDIEIAERKHLSGREVNRFAC